jgi:Ion channel
LAVVFTIRDVLNQQTLNPISTFKKSVNDAGEKGIEKLVSLFLYLVLHLFPGIYIREYVPENKRGVWIEGYVLLKLILALLFFYFGWYTNYLERSVLIYFSLETILYNLFFILCNNLFPPARSYKRVLVLGFINYVEIVLNFASLYAGLKLIVKASDVHNSKFDKIDYIYFSIGTGGVLGFGDYSVTDSVGKCLAIVQCIVFMMFFILFITYNTSMFMESRK